MLKSNRLIRRATKSICRKCGVELSAKNEAVWHQDMEAVGKCKWCYKAEIEQTWKRYGATCGVCQFYHVCTGLGGKGRCPKRKHPVSVIGPPSSCKSWRLKGTLGTGENSSQKAPPWSVEFFVWVDLDFARVNEEAAQAVEFLGSGVVVLTTAPANIFQVKRAVGVEAGIEAVASVVLEAIPLIGGKQKRRAARIAGCPFDEIRRLG